MLQNLAVDSLHLKVVLILTVGFGLASILGYLSHRAKLSPILGYLLAGYAIGPYSPGFVADMEVSEQLAEIGVVLMMFGVGLQFKLQDLLSVKKIAIPGALGQTLLAATFGAVLTYALGWSVEAGIVIGLAIGVASTVMLVRLLTDNDLLGTRRGHIAVGWLIVEDIITVFVLLLLPTLAASLNGHHISYQDIGASVAIALCKFIILVAFMATLGRLIVKYALSKIVTTNSSELFTLTILALTFVIATGSAVFFGASIALGAFVAGIIIGETDVRHQVSASAMPLKDAFVVVFFLSVGMLFNPYALLEHPHLFLGVLAIILLIKPLVAFLIVILLKHPMQTALTVAIALAQIGEFSFILSEEAMKLNILPDAGYDIVVACAFISISLNPLLFKIMGRSRQENA
jgi:CPA2 family monovalent cation:H+ antiporter-2